jgi:hypothetical protein
VVHTSNWLQPTQDGGKCSEWRANTLPTREERLCTSTKILIRRANISMLVRERTIFHTNGTLSMLINGREIQEKENSTRDSVSMFKEISILFQD